MAQVESKPVVVYPNTEKCFILDHAVHAWRLRVVWLGLDMEALELDKLLEPEFRQRDAAPRLLPSRPSKILPVSPQPPDSLHIPDLDNRID